MLNHNIVPPLDPTPSKPIQPPMIYVKDKVRWEYQIIVRDFENESPINTDELTALGKAGWELSGVAQHVNQAYYYFKRLAD